MRRTADLYPDEARTDAKDAAVIPDAARTMPPTLCSPERTDQITPSSPSSAHDDRVREEHDHRHAPAAGSRSPAPIEVSPCSVRTTWANDEQIRGRPADLEAGRSNSERQTADTE